MAGFVTVQELAKEVGTTSESILALCAEMGVEARTAGTRLMPAQADRLRRRHDRDRLGDAQTTSGAPQPPDSDRARTGAGSGQDWMFTLSPRLWQETALAKWRNAGRRGVIEAATGTGKTALALRAIAELHDEFGADLRVAVVVPTLTLARQWREELESKLHLRRTVIGEQHSDPMIEWGPQHPVLLTVVNTARDHLFKVLQQWEREERQVLLIVDECHRLGSGYNSLALEGTYQFSLGLSATPERDDGGDEDFVYPLIGTPVFRYPLKEALADRALAELISVNLYVDLDAAEQQHWDELTQEIGQAFQRLISDHPHLAHMEPGRAFAEIGRLAKQAETTAGHLLLLVGHRRDLLIESSQRQRCTEEVLDWLADSNRKALVFHETTLAAELSVQHLRDRGVGAALDHSKLQRNEREAAMTRFRRGDDRILVAVRALDEGVDVPDADVAVIACGSRSARQRIQRFGRVLRQQDGKEALVVSILARGTPEEDAVGARDDLLLESKRVRHHRWPTVSIAEAVRGQSSSYRSGAPDDDLADDLLRSELHLQPARPSNARRSDHASPAQVSYSVNGWHDAENIRHQMGVSPEWFEPARAEVRKRLESQLDERKRSDPTLVHGQEVAELIRRHQSAGGSYSPTFEPTKKRKK